MFTGIVTDIGTVSEVERGSGTATSDARLTIETSYDTSAIELGASIACSGCCLTVVETQPGCFKVDVSNETLSVTTLGQWQPGTKVNLERSLRLGEELGGHLVYGHVDAVARVMEHRQDGASTRFVFEVPEALGRFIAPKGSIALDGVSLTVNEVGDRRFTVNVIPHTEERTTFSERRAGDFVNLEIDMLARYVARLSEVQCKNRKR